MKCKYCSISKVRLCEVCTCEYVKTNKTYDKEKNEQVTREIEIKNKFISDCLRRK